MNLLALDTSTETLSLAVRRGERLLTHSGAAGAQASHDLLAALQALMAEAGLAFAELDAIAFGRGPGSFTGLRTACAVAQGLAFGARPGGVPVLAIDSLLALAEEARHQWGVTQVVAALDARMDEVYAAAFTFAGGHWQGPADFELLAPEQLAVPAGWALVGNADAAYPGRMAPAVAPAQRLAALPTASAMLRLAPAMLAAGQAVAPALALPRYIRDKVAKTTAERAAERSAQATPAEGRCP